MERISFYDACLKWQADRARFVKETSMAAYSLTITNHLVPRFEWLDEITSSSIQDLVEWESDKGESPTTIKGIIVVLKMVMKYCVRQGWIEPNPIDVHLPVRTRKPDPQVLTIDEEKLLLGWLTSHPTLKNIGVLFCLCCGLRIGEVCGLKWEDFDQNRRVIHIRRTVHRIYRPGKETGKSELTLGRPKTEDSRREVPVAKFLAHIINKVYPESPEDKYILSGYRQPLDPQTFRANFKKVTSTLGLKTRKIHSLRHTFATRCLESNCDVKTLSALFGHSDVSTTLNLYVHPGIEQKRRCVEDMMNLFIYGIP